MANLTLASEQALAMLLLNQLRSFGYLVDSARPRGRPGGIGTECAGNSHDKVRGSSIGRAGDASCEQHFGPQ